MLLGVALLAAACGDAPQGPAAEEPSPAPPYAAVERAEVELEVDAAGVFVSTEPVHGAWFGGFGVRCLLPPRGATDGHRIVGRLAGNPVVLLRRVDGELDSLQPALRRVERSLLGELHAAAAGVDVPEGATPQLAAFLGGVRAAADEPAPERPPLPPRAQPGVPREPPHAAGTPLLAWAPEGTLAVCFRSVEAGFRFADLADRLAGRIAAAQGEGGDHEPLRLTLHHLLLPSIWRANPNGRKGVAECLLIVAPPYRPGALDAAVVLRIVDPELHDHESRAGVALETRAEHLWRPPDDPFPERRVRTAVRATAGDCEVVATSERLLERILSGPGRVGGAWDAEAVAARNALPPGDRRRALTLVAPPAATQWWAIADMEAWVGARRLAERWLGLAVPPAPADFGGPAPVVEPWSGVRALTADTDAQGAAVSVRMSDTGSAAALAELLAALPGERARLDAACRGNLAALVPLGIVEPRAADVAERAFLWFGRRPVCPLGGAYHLHPATGAPSCRVHGDGSADTSAADLPASPVSAVSIDGTLVTFRLSIDW